MSNHLSEIDQLKKDMVVDLIWDCVLRGSLLDPLNNRVKDVMACWESTNNLKKLSHELPDCSSYTPTGEFYFQTFFSRNSNNQLHFITGIPLKSEHLNLNEKHLMSKELEKLILNTYHESIRKINELTNNELNSGSISETEDATLTPEQRKIISLCEKYRTILEGLHKTNLEMCHSMKEWIDLRLGVKIASLERRSELCRYKSNLVELKTK